MSVFTEVLAIEVGLKGAETVLSGVEKLINKFHLCEEAVGSLKQGLFMMGAAAGIAVGGLREAMELEKMTANVEGLTDSLVMTRFQMEKIEEISAKGIFPKEQVYEAVRTLDKFGASVKNNIELVEKLGARSGDLAGAAALVGGIESGQTHGLSRRLREFGLGPQKLRAVGLVVDGMEVKGSAAEILAGLRKIEESDKLLEHLQGTLGAGIGQLVYEFKELVETVGEPLLKPVNACLRVIVDLVKWMKELNKETHGFVSTLLLIGTALAAVGKLVEFMKTLELLSKLNAFWTAITTNLMSGWNTLVTIIGQIIARLLVMIGAEQVAAAWLAIVDALSGNWVALGVAAAIAAAVGVAWAGGAFGGGKPSEGGPLPSGEKPADRPHRRDEIERLHKRIYGRAWSG